MNYKTQSSQVVLSKIYRDLKPKDSSWEVDAIEWIGEALEFIGYFSGFELKEKQVRVHDHRAILPPELYTLLLVKVGNLKLREENGIDPLSFGRTAEIVYRTNLTNTGGDYSFQQLTIYPNEYYYLEPNYIKTSFGSGMVRLIYLGFPVDDCGYPMIPDNIVVKQAIEWYIIRQMILGGYEHRFLTWDVADINWKHYCVAAGNDLAYPSIERMEDFKDKWVRMIPYIKPNNYTIGEQMDQLTGEVSAGAGFVPHTHPEYVSHSELGEVSDMDIDI